MRPRFVLDAWAILALLQKEEPAATQVKQILLESKAGQIELYISVINLGEVYYRVGRIKGKVQAQRTLADIQRLLLTVVPAGEDAVWAAAELKMQYAISYADAFAAAAAEELGATLVSGDPELEQLGERIPTKWLERE